MSIRTFPWPVGTPCWADVAGPDLPAALDFYGAVLGWAFDDADDEFGGYVNGRVGGEHVAGLMPPMSDAPVAWTLYLASADADATAAAITEHGGTVHAGPDDVGDLGRMVVASDPSGATFGVWQAGTHIGTRVYGAPGALAWEDLRSTDPAAAQAFYGAVFGVEARPLEMAGPDYATFHLAGDDAPLGGIGPMMGAEGGSHWLVYFAVADVDAAVATATEHGGSVTGTAFDSPYGRMAGLTDPNGARFMVVAPSGPQPDRSG